MLSKRLKTVGVHLLLLSTSLIQPIFTQQFNNVPRSGQFVQNGQFSTFPSNKGYYPPQTGGIDYITHPVNGKYWTGPVGGHVQPHFQPPHYPQYGPQYGGIQQVYPGQYGYWNSPHGGFNQWNNLQYQSFDPSYWTGSHYHPSHYPAVYPQPHPVYPHSHPAYHPAYYQNAMYPGHYLYHQRPYGANPYNQRGFLGGTGKGIAKGLLGALLVGVVAGTVARGK